MPEEKKPFTGETEIPDTTEKEETRDIDTHGLGRIQWFPGHMAKAMRKTEEDLKLCDGVLYVLDARAPYACMNPKLKFVKTRAKRPHGNSVRTHSNPPAASCKS